MLSPLNNHTFKYIKSLLSNYFRVFLSATVPPEIYMPFNFGEIIDLCLPGIIGVSTVLLCGQVQEGHFPSTGSVSSQQPSEQVGGMHIESHLHCGQPSSPITL